MDVSKEVRLRSWAEDLANQKASGLPIKEWCKEKNICVKTFEYRRKQVYSRMSSMSESSTSNYPAVANGEIVKVEMKESLDNLHTDSLGITITRDDTVINIKPDSNLEHIKIVMEAILHA